MSTINAYLWLSTIIFMFILLCLAVYSYSLRYQKEIRRSRSASVFTISQYFGSDQHMRQPPPMYNTRTDLPPSYDQVVIGINVAPAAAPTPTPTLAPERTRAQ